MRLSLCWVSFDKASAKPEEVALGLENLKECNDPWYGVIGSEDDNDELVENSWLLFLNLCNSSALSFLSSLRELTVLIFEF